MNDDERIEHEIKAVLQLLKDDYPQAVDYTCSMDDEDAFDILDANDDVIARVSSQYITDLWNRMEGILTIRV